MGADLRIGVVIEWPELDRLTSHPPWRLKNVRVASRTHDLGVLFEQFALRRFGVELDAIPEQSLRNVAELAQSLAVSPIRAKVQATSSAFAGMTGGENN